MLILALTLLAPNAHAAAPGTLTHAGRLFDSGGVPLEGPHDLHITLYDDPAGGALRWSETVPATLTDGYFAVNLGITEPITPAVLADALWVGLAVGDAPEAATRLPLQSVPYAIVADTATNVSGGVVDASELRIGGTTIIDGSGTIVSGAPDPLGELGCAAGEIPRFDGLDWGCVGEAAHAHSAADLTSGVLAIERIPVGRGAGEVAPGDHTHDAAEILTGTLNVDRIPGLDAAKITSGTFAAAQIPGLDAAKITGGTLDMARLPVGTTASTVARGDHTHTAAQVGALPIGGGNLTGPITVAGQVSTPRVNVGSYWSEWSLRMQARGDGAADDLWWLGTINPGDYDNAAMIIDVCDAPRWSNPGCATWHVAFGHYSGNSSQPAGDPYAVTRVSVSGNGTRTPIVVAYEGSVVGRRSLQVYARLGSHNNMAYHNATFHVRTHGEPSEFTAGDARRVQESTVTLLP